MIVSRAPPIKGPSITSFRARVREIGQSENLRGNRRNIVVFALDGIPFNLALRCWPHACIEPMLSVFPTTSSAAWLSALTGARVDTHGIPGVVFRLKPTSTALINVYQHSGELGIPRAGNIFSDFRALGYLPISLAGDLSESPCSWLHVLLESSRVDCSHHFYSDANQLGAHVTSNLICSRIQAAIGDAINSYGCSAPLICWCFVEVDRYIHSHGYDEHVIDLVGRIDRLAENLVNDGAVVVAHSDHGLVPTIPDDEVSALMRRLQAEHHFQVGGAGRTRWLYAATRDDAALLASMREAFAGIASVDHADLLFAKGSLARERVGGIVLQAESERFLTESSYKYDHGAYSDAESVVPYAVWGAERTEPARDPIG